MVVCLATQASSLEAWSLAIAMSSPFDRMVVRPSSRVKNSSLQPFLNAPIASSLQPFLNAPIAILLFEPSRDELMQCLDILLDDAVGVILRGRALVSALEVVEEFLLQVGPPED